ncbi:MAG: GTP diphosphokinase [Legionellales bacterium RIFCSPHIGHO2_12_FULL_37_14]|nr:MAG: GTP diphosphokinase [Legionellales bacterium RIFCSPHIGHO2_12_FULL_37_14]
MVKAKEDNAWLVKDNVQVEQWMEHLAKKGYKQHVSIIKDACLLSQLTGEKQPTDTKLSCLQMGLIMADILLDLQVDVETLTAALLYPEVAYSVLSIEDIKEQFGLVVANMLQGVLRMRVLSTETAVKNTQQLDNIRKMLLVMVDDVRVVLVKLAERLCVLREAQNFPENTRIALAKEAMHIYAPLAHRLGVGILKWELEDLAFRYLKPEIYKEIATGLKLKRIERDKYVAKIIEDIKKALAKHNLENVTVYGRSKHIYSIYRKMQLKQLSLEEIHDATAVRILADNVDDCFTVLSIVHSLWEPVKEEFDDYISKPKPNGYQSLHTAVIGPKKRLFEIQIRTYNMHEFAEMGMAAHWKYKEGAVVSQKPGYEKKIAWLREVLAWHKELSLHGEEKSMLEHDFLDDRVYVFTPHGEILDLPVGATALDFAYHVHTDIGHRCRGAKVNATMVPLNCPLKTGDRIEVLTTKESKPSRDWLNPHLNYLFTSRAKAKVLHWFKMQDYDLHLKEGQALVEKELKALAIKQEYLQGCMRALNFKSLPDLYAAVGRGDLKLAQIVNRLTPQSSIEPLPPKVALDVPVTKKQHDNLVIEGVGKLLTNMARCCRPLPGDEVIGYITLGRGVSIHRKDCNNILFATEKQRRRFLAVNWSYKACEKYLVDLLIMAFDRSDILKDITQVLATEKTHIYQLQMHNQQESLQIKLKIDVVDLEFLAKIIAKLNQVPNVLEVKRI